MGLEVQCLNEIYKDILLIGKIYTSVHYNTLYIRCDKCRSRGSLAGKIVLCRAGPPHRAASVSLLLGPEFPLTTWFSTPHLPWITTLTDVPKPPELANKGPRQTDPHDTQTNAARRMAHRNASLVPQRECKTSCAQQHLRVHCTSGLQMYCQQKRDEKLLYRSACVLGCLCVWVTVCIHIYTGHTFVFI